MLTEKQLIDDLARIVCKDSSNRGICEKCGFYEYRDCNNFRAARRLYEAGFRKGANMNEFIYEMTTDFDGVDFQIKRGVIVRCRDCKYTRYDDTGSIYCEELDQWEMPEDGYCFKGKKK